MNVWLYAAASAMASQDETLSLAYRSGFIWRSFYNQAGSAIACVREIRPGDELVLGYRRRGAVKLLARFRVGRPDNPIAESSVFGEIPFVWNDEFRQRGYDNDPKLGVLVGVFVEEAEPLSGVVPYRNQNSVSRMAAPVGSGSQRIAAGSPVLSRSDAPGAELDTTPAAAGRFNTGPGDGLHVGIDVGGRQEKGFDLCVTEWQKGLLKSVRWQRLRHAILMPPTSSLRSLVRDGGLSSVAAATYASASATAAALWHVIQPLGATGVYIDSPSAFSRNCRGHGRLCEKRSLTGVSFQSTPSIACGNEHGGDWGWLLYGMVAFSACLHQGQLTGVQWVQDLEKGTFTRCDSAGIVLRECFPTATISVLRSHKREADAGRSLSGHDSLREVQAVLGYLKYGVKGVKRPNDALYDRADSLVAALTALPYVADNFQEQSNWPISGGRWAGIAGEEQIEGLFTCVL